jgi:luciferase family oxidoreductase group 1
VRTVPLSALDLATVGTGATAHQALQATLEHARRAEAAGFTRFWVAEHHNMPGIASSAPAVLIAAVAGATSRIRVGSGGVMLPNHAPLVVAEQFATLEALWPGRIDLGIGRAPGTDGATARALRRGAVEVELPELLAELVGFLRDSFPADHPYRRLRAVPHNEEGPPIWLLGSSGYSAQVAGWLGLPFAFAHHFSAENTLPALSLYRRSFRPSRQLAAPYAAIGVQVLCARDDAEAIELSAPAALSFLRLRSGQPSTIPSLAEARAHPWTEAERAAVAHRREQQAVGGPDTVRRRLGHLLEETGADELIVTTLIHDPADRLASLERLCDLTGPLPKGLGA